MVSDVMVGILSFQSDSSECSNDNSLSWHRPRNLVTKLAIVANDNFIQDQTSLMGL